MPGSEPAGAGARQRFVGRQVVVTGASSGIGRATTLAFVGEGASVLAIARRESRLHDLAAEVASLDGGGSIETAAVDVRDRAALRACVSSVAAGGGIDVLVNNAGVAYREGLLEVSDDHLDATVETNLTAVFVASQEAARHMVTRGGGVIVNVASIDAFVAESPFGAYCATKAGVVMLTRCFAYEFGHLGLRCNAVCPGMTVSEMTEPDLTQEFTDNYLPRIPASRFGRAREQASAILFLASDDSSFVNGATLDVDGGQRAGFWYGAGPEPAMTAPAGSAQRPAGSAQRPAGSAQPSAGTGS